MSDSAQPAGPRTQRARLGAELRRLRRLAGVSERSLARQLGIGQSSVSRIENGVGAVPPLPRVMAWADAVGAPEESRQVLAGLAEAAVNEVESWRARAPGDGLAVMQRNMQALESAAGRISVVQTAIVPALLHTPAYAKWVFVTSDPTGEGDADAAVTARTARQQVLYAPGKTFEFIVTAAALQTGPKPVLRAQLDRLAVAAGMPNVDVGVIPAGTQEPNVIVWSGFNLYDDRADGEPTIATIELPHGRVVVEDPADVQIYRDQLDLLRRNAVHGDEAAELIRATATRL